eukprot:Skav229027  [mRNA]  locus=scaffold127:633131:633938:- [translate_table: standard]
MRSNGSAPDDEEKSVPRFCRMPKVAYAVQTRCGRGASIWDTYVGANTVGMPGSAPWHKPKPKLFAAASCIQYHLPRSQ